MSKKPTIIERVTDAQESLAELAASGGSVALRAWAIDNGMDSAAGFSGFKRALAVIGIDFDALRDAHRAATRAAIPPATHAVTLFSDAKASKSRFGITDADGNPVWFGRFFEDDRDFDGEQSSGEMAAAKKAVWLAAQIAKHSGAPRIALLLMVDAEWLCWATATDGRGGKARALGEAARRLNVELRVEHVPGAENPADKYTICSGFQSYKSIDLAALARPVAA